MFQYFRQKILSVTYLLKLRWLFCANVVCWVRFRWFRWCFWEVVWNQLKGFNNNYHNLCMYISHSRNIYSQLCNLFELFTCNAAIFIACHIYQQILLITTFVWSTLCLFRSVQYHSLFEFWNPVRGSHAHFPLRSTTCQKFWINSQTPTEMQTHFETCIPSA